MIATWITGIFTLLGTIVGGLVTFYVNKYQFVMQKQWDQKQLIRQKLEDICQTIDKINDSYRYSTVEVL